MSVIPQPTITYVDRLRLNEGTPLSVARRIAKEAKRLRLTLKPGLYLSSQGEGMVCFVGLMTVGLAKDTLNLPFDNGALVQEIEEILHRNRSREWDPSLIDWEWPTPELPVDDNYSGDDLRTFIADHATTVSIKEIEDIESGFENETIHLDGEEVEMQPYNAFTGGYSPVPPGRFMGQRRAAWQRVSRAYQIGFYLRLIAQGHIS